MSVRTILMAASGAQAAAPAGQAVFLAGTTSWTVPAGVTSICVVAVQGGGTPGISAIPVTVTVSGTVVCRAQNENRLGDGGGDGGPLGPGYWDGESFYPGAGSGAGGYSGTGGSGAGYGASASPGNGGGGGGGNSGGWGADSAGYGGGVGLTGGGSSGAAGVGAFTPDYHGSPGSNGSTVTYGGGMGASTTTLPGSSGGRGGALAYKNNIAVTPGQSVAITIPAALGGAGAAAVRIIWGAGRSFPSTNTGDV